MSDSKNGKIAMVLLPKKKKKATCTPTAVGTGLLLEEDFGAATNNVTSTQPQERSLPLVIPMTQATTGPLDKLKQEDAAAAQALVESAARHYQSQQVTINGDTNFSATGNLQIASRENTFTRQPKNNIENDAQQLQRDLQNRAKNVEVDSSVYTQVPIAEFGAALLRGMGWKGNDGDNSHEKEDSFRMPRPHRLGLGATPTLPELSSSNKMKRPDQVQREARLAQQHEEYQAKREQQVRLDKQKTLQIGSIIRIQNKRGKMVQLLGVPGLNQVLVQYEGESTNASVKKGSVVLVSRDELEKRPYLQVKEEQEHSKVKREHEQDGGRDKKRIKREEENERNQRHHNGRDDADNRQGRHDRPKDRSSSSRNESRNAQDQRRKTNDTSERHWLIPYIRVRVVTKKLSSRQYKQKGMVLDVTHGGAHGTLEMSNGQILDRVPERYLETALPKVGGNAIILTGKHRLQKGKLLERNSDSGTGVIQIFEDMNVVKLALDDMAEWCGPLDDDLEL